MFFRRFSPQIGLSETDETALWAGMQAGKGEEQLESAEPDPAAGSYPSPCGFFLRTYRHRLGSLQSKRAASQLKIPADAREPLTNSRLREPARC